MAEGRDWTRSQFEACPECGADASAVPDHELGAAVLREVAAWGRTLASADGAALRIRDRPEVWSALEYACHVRDLLPIMSERVALMRAEDEPDLGWWDHEAAVVDEDYNGRDPVVVLESMGANARGFAAEMRAVRDGDWQRGAERRPGERFTVQGLARFVLHEVIHHREDAQRALRRAFPQPEEGFHG